MGSTEALVKIARSVDASSLPASVLTVAKHCVLDFLGVTLAGSREPALKLLYEHVGCADRGDEAVLLGLGARSSLLNAALIHGTAAHALDYDDTHWGLQGHPTAPVMAAIWGLAAREGSSGRALLEALIAGVEVECRLGRWLNRSITRAVFTPPEHSAHSAQQLPPQSSWGWTKQHGCTPSGSQVHKPRA